MKRFLLSAAWSLAVVVSPASFAGNAWTDFRGPTQDGRAPADAKPPTKWTEAGAKWRTPIPGEGHSSPIIWNNQAWITTALDGGRSLHAIGVDIDSGKVLHDIEVFKDPNPAAKHSLNSYASPSAVIEAGRVWVYFGNPGLACIDTETGKVLWKKTDIRLNYETGAGSSPVLYRDTIIYHCDAVDDQFVVAVDKNTGKEAWRTKRSKPYGPLANKKRAFSTPVIATVGGREQLLSIGAQRTYGYDPATGKELWHVDHGGYSNVCRPLVADDLVVFSTCYDKPDLLAVRPGQSNADGTAKALGNADVAWTQKAGIPNKPSLLYHAGRIWLIAENGVARCLDPRTGNSIWNQRLGQMYSASPLLAGGKIYFLSEKGQVHVVEPGESPKIVEEFQLEEGFMASPAVIGNALILRSKGHLYRVEQ